MTPFRISMLVLVAIVAVIVYRSSADSSALAYVADWDEAVEQSRTTGKPLLLSFGGPW